MMIINRKFLRERRHSRISRRHLCNSTAAAAFRFDVSARLRLLMARRYGVTRPPGPLPPSREERRGGWRTTKSAKAPKLQEDKRMHASSFYGRPMLEPRWRREREKSEWSERAREREGTHALSKCATLWAPLGTLALFSRGTNPPLLLSTVRSYQIFSFFFFFFLSRLLRRHDSLPKYWRVPSAGVRPSSSGQSLRGGGGAGNRESAVPLSSVPSVNGTARGFRCGFYTG